MTVTGKISKTEKLLLAMTGLFLCGMLGLHLHDRGTGAERPSVPVETAAEKEAPRRSLQALDLNAATAEELEQLPGIGPKLAARIVAYRKENGPFASVEELMDVKGIGQGKFDALAGLIAVK